MKIRTIAKLLAAPVAFLMLSGMYYRGHMFTIDFPDGWQAPVVKEDNIVTVSTLDGVNCNAQTNEVAAMKDLRLEQINSEFDHVFNAADWANLLDLPIAGLTVSKGEQRQFGDAFFQIATLGMKSDDGLLTTARFGVYVLPGRVTMAGCYVLTSNYRNWEATFDKTVSSLRPW